MQRNQERKKTILTKRTTFLVFLLLDLNIYYKATLVKIVQYWHKLGISMERMGIQKQMHTYMVNEFVAKV